MLLGIDVNVKTMYFEDRWSASYLRILVKFTVFQSCNLPNYTLFLSHKLYHYLLLSDAKSNIILTIRMFIYLFCCLVSVTNLFYYCARFFKTLYE